MTCMIGFFSHIFGIEVSFLWVSIHSLSIKLSANSLECFMISISHINEVTLNNISSSFLHRRELSMKCHLRSQYF